MTPTLLLVLGALSLIATIVTLVRVRHPAIFSFPIMMTSWLLGEYPLFFVGTQAIVAALLAALGGLDEPRGIVGLALYGISWVGLLVARHVSTLAEPTAEAALTDALGDDYVASLRPERQASLRDEIDPVTIRHPLRFDNDGLTIDRDVAYGQHGKRNQLDVYRRTDGVEAAPVVLQIHGGAWMIGHKAQQAQPLLHQLARSGYVCVSMNYRLSPRARFPDHIIDVKRAIAWVRNNIADYGGDPDTIILTGGSAGGHLASLAALTPDLDEWQPGFESVDTSVAGCAPFYGPADFRDRHGIRGKLASMEPMLGRMVMPLKQSDDPELWDKVSPITHVRADAPPFLVIQGANDVLVWREEARQFVDALRAVSHQPVGYWEVPGAQHAFDTFNSRRSWVAVDAVERFVGWVEAHASDRQQTEVARGDT